MHPGRILAAAAPLAGISADASAADDYFERSDNLRLSQVGIPAHTLYVAADFPDYHRVGGEWPKMDYENMANRAVALALPQLASEAPPPKWNTSIPAAAATRQVPRRRTPSPD
jgi:hypothetical protein